MTEMGRLLTKLSKIENRIDTVEADERAELEMLFIHNLKQLIFQLPSRFHNEVIEYSDLLIIHSNE